MVSLMGSFITDICIVIKVAILAIYDLVKYDTFISDTTESLGLHAILYVII